MFKTEMDVENRKGWVVCFGGEDWWYHSHGHFDIQTMKRFAKENNVLYICSIGMRMPSLLKDKSFFKRILRKLKSISHMLRKIDSHLFIFSPFPLPFYGTLFGRALNTIVLRLQFRLIFFYLKISTPLMWINTPTAWPIIKKFQRSGTVYQRTDDYAAYDFDNFNNSYIKSIDTQLLNNSDLVIHVSEELHKEAVAINRNSILVTQGVDEKFFNKDGILPEDLKNIPGPLIGYIGGMDRHKFDTALVFDVAKRLNKYSFVLIGPANPNTDILRELHNVYFLGVKEHEQIPDYVHNFDVCIVPTAQTDWGLKCRPLKLMEYLAKEKIIIATPTPASNAFRHYVMIADDSESWVKNITKSITDLGNDTVSRKNAIKLESWNELAKKFWKELESKGLVCKGFNSFS